MDMVLCRYAYYARSIIPLLTRVVPLPAVLRAFLGRPGRVPFQVRLRPSGLRFKVRGAMDLWVLKEVCLEHEYERFGFAPQDGWKILDVGAGLGEFTVLAAARRPGAQVYAYEPFAPSFALLQENIRLNGLGNVQAVQAAVGPCCGQARLESAGREAVMVQAQAAAGQTEGCVPVEALADVLAKMGRCDLLKMDCEGCEYGLMLGGDAQVWSAVQRITMEYHEHIDGHNHPELVAALQGYGFRVEAFPRATHPDVGFIRAWRE